MDKEKTELRYILALLAAPNIGLQTIRKLLHHYGSAENVFREKKQESQKIPGVGHKIIEFIDDQLLEIADDELEFANKNDIKILYYKDDDYPALLKEIPDAPIVLFQKGNFDWAAYKHYLGVVGTRKATPYGKTQCETLLTGISETQITPVIVSGLALGIDTCAHQLALKKKMPTVGVMAFGFRKVYPPQNKSLFREIIDNGGALITESFSFEEPERHNFVKRNRIIAGLSQATVVVESGKKGGALLTASYAMEYNRDIFTFPGCTHMPSFAGCHQLIKNNMAALIENADDLIKGIGWNNQPNAKQLRMPLPEDLTSDEQQIISILKQGKTSVDTLIKKTHLKLSELSYILLNLEMKGYVSALPGNFYELK